MLVDSHTSQHTSQSEWAEVRHIKLCTFSTLFFWDVTATTDWRMTNTSPFYVTFTLAPHTLDVCMVCCDYLHIYRRSYTIWRFGGVYVGARVCSGVYMCVCVCMSVYLDLPLLPPALGVGTHWHIDRLAIWHRTQHTTTPTDPNLLDLPRLWTRDYL